MRLIDLAENVKLQIEVSYKGTKIYYETQVKFTAFNGVFIDPIKQDEKMLEFNSGNLMINVTAEIDGSQPIIWRECEVKGVKYKNQVYHMITAKRGGLAINRRGRFRIDMGYTGTARVGSDKGALNVVVHDLSSSGFSFTTEKDIEGYENQYVQLIFIDTSNDAHLNLVGVIVRKQDWNNNRYLYGCKFNKINNMVEYYIAKKQRQMLSLNTVNKKNIIELKDKK